jgi:subtilase family serine protease
MNIKKFLAILISLAFLPINAIPVNATDATAKPDPKIAAEDLSISPTTIKDGISVTFKAKVRNGSTAKATSVKVRFFAGDVQLGEKIISSISANSYYSTSLTYKIPATMVGEQTYRLVVDPDNTIDESDESNNEATKIFTVLSNLPDLSIVPADMTYLPATLKAGDKGTFKATIHNLGIATGKNVPVKFYLGEVMIGQTVISSVSANGKMLKYVTYTIPAGFSGNAEYKVVVDPDNIIQELSETNNQASVQIGVGAATVDLAILATSIVFSKTSPKPGESVKISAVVKNLGNTDAKSAVARFMINGVKAGEKTGMLIKAGKETAININYTIPTTFVGPLSAVITADPDNAIAESDETNNSAASELGLTALNIDLAITSAALSKSPEPIIAGRKFKIAGKVKNIGVDKAVATKLTISLVTYEQVKVDKDTIDKSILTKLKKGGAVPLEDLILEREKEMKYEEGASESGTKRVLKVLGTYNVPSLNAGKDNSFSKEMTLPSDYKEESAELEITADAENAITGEVDRANNMTLLTIDTLPKSYDAMISEASISHTPTGKDIMAGKNVTVRAVVSNLGTEKLSGLKVNYYLATKPVLDGATLITSKTVSSLNEGKSSSMNYTFMIPATATENQVVLIVVDPDNKVSESDEQNNLATHTIPITAQTRDLVIESMKSSPASPKIGQAMNFKVKVRNLGNSKAENIQVGIYTDLSSDQPALTKTISSIPSGGSSEQSFNWTVPSALAFAVNYPIRAKVDYTNAINETNEENNNATIGLTLKVPDLELIPELASARPDTIYKGENFVVSGAIRNTNVLATSSVKVALLYTIAGQTNTLTKLTDTDLGAFAKGETKNFTMYAKLPDSVAVGTNVILTLMADSEGSVLETSETNNRLQIARTVTDPPRRVQYPTLEVVVYDDTGEKLNGATVTLKPVGGTTTEQKVTGADDFYYSVGKVIFESRPTQQNYDITVSAPGYRTLTDTINYNPDVDWTSDYKEFTMDKKAIVTGKVTATGGAALSSVLVKVVDTDIATWTDSGGNYRLALNGGNYTFKFLKDGYTRVVEPVNLSPLTEMTLNKTMSATTMGYVEGIITNDDGAAMSGVTIKNNGTSVGQTDANGKFSLTLAAGKIKFNFSKTDYVSVDIPETTLTAGKEEFIAFSMYKPSTDTHIERGTSFVSWHQHEGTPANAFFIPEYNVDVWWGIGQIKMAMDFATTDSTTKITKLTVRMKGEKWECHKVEGEGDIETSAINIPITIAAGGCDNEINKITVAKVAIVSNEEEIWNDESSWSSTDDPANNMTKTYTFTNQPITWNDSFKVRVWFRVEKSAVMGIGDGAGALTGFNLDKKMVTWNPKKPPTTTVSTSLGQFVDYIWGAVSNPVSLITGFTDLFTVEQYNQYTMQEVMPWDYPGYPPQD